MSGATQRAVGTITLGLMTKNRPQEILNLIKSLGDVQAFRNSKYPLEIVLIDDASDTDTSQVVEEIKHILAKESVQFKFERNDYSVGCTRNRDRIKDMASGDIIIFIDDDSLAADPFFFNKIASVFENNPDIGIFAFPVYNIFQNRVLVPHKRKNYLSKSEFYTYFFLGGGHAVWKDAMQQVNGYSPEIGDRGEEYDLAFKTIKAGFTILYKTDTFIIHLESGGGRKPYYDRVIDQATHKILLAWKYLPLRFVLTNAIVWTFYAVVKTKSLRSIIDIYKSLISKIKVSRRQPLTGHARKYLKKVNARLWF
ncbi:MAG: glycosyltransferase [Chlorobi bacterium]|nr:glycosyltransferase [Chlorobiota bacterium]